MEDEVVIARFLKRTYFLGLAGGAQAGKAVGFGREGRLEHRNRSGSVVAKKCRFSSAMGGPGAQSGSGSQRQSYPVGRPKKWLQFLQFLPLGLLDRDASLLRTALWARAHADFSFHSCYRVLSLPATPNSTQHHS